MNKCCLDILKFFVFIFNFAAFLSCAALFSLGIYALVKSSDVFGFKIFTNLSPDNPTAVWFSLALIFIVVFGFLTLFMFLGCCGVCCQNRCMLGSFIIILFVFLGGFIGGIAYVFITFPNEYEMAASELNNTLPYYKTDSTESIVVKFWDWVQPTLKCCGVTSWRDWSAKKVEFKSHHVVPSSCCINSGGDCEADPTIENAYLDGCLYKFQLPFRIIFWGVPSLMALILIFSLCLCSNCKKRDLDGSEPVSPRRKNRQPRYPASGSETEETGYVYRRTPTPNYPVAPPYNPDYPPRGDYRNSTDYYPTGVIPPHCQPLIQPPSYHDVVGR